MRKICNFYLITFLFFKFKGKRAHIFEMFVKKTKKDVLCFRLQFVCLTCKIVTVIQSQTEAELPDVLSHTFLTAKFPSEMNLVDTGRFTKTGG